MEKLTNARAIVLLLRHAGPWGEDEQARKRITSELYTIVRRLESQVDPDEAHEVTG